MFFMSKEYRVLIRGKRASSFFSILLSKGISIYQKEEVLDGIILVLDREGYLLVTSIPSSCSIVVLNRYGIAKIKYLLSKYYGLILGGLFFFFVLFFLSHLIFHIEVIHPSKKIQKLVIEDLKELGISRFRFKVNYLKRGEIVDKILAKEKDNIEWLSIEESGTKYIVKVIERKRNAKEVTYPYQSIVAKKDAMILDIEAEEGEVVKKKYDYVEKGDVIISGLIYNKEDIVSKRAARGKVYGEVWYQVHLEIPKKYYEENVTGKKTSLLEIQFLNHTYHLFSHYSTYKKESVTLLQSKILPISLYYSTYMETEVINKNYNVSNVNRYALSLAEEKLNKKLDDDEEILSKKILKKYEKDSKIIVEVFFKVKEDITDTLNIENYDISNQREEE